METLEYYKLKDELGGLIKDEISKSLSSERDLQHRYIGMGLKVAAGGIAAAVLTLGVFGIKSFYEVDSAIRKIPTFIAKRVDTEVTTRFNSVNPVAQYEIMLLESAARSIAASITTQLKGQPSFITLEERYSDVIVRTLNETNIRLSAKLSLIDAISTDKIRVVSPAIDQAVTTIAQQVAAADPFDERNLVRCIKYFSHRSPDRFAVVVEKIYDARSGISSVRLATGRYAMALRKEYGDDLIKKLATSGDSDVRYLMHMRDLRIGGTKQIDQELFKATLARVFSNDSGDSIGLSDIIDHIGSLRGIEDYINLQRSTESSTDTASQLLEYIRDYATSKNLSLAVEDDSLDSMSFRFYTADGNEASAGIDLDRFTILIRLAAIRIRDSLRQSKGEFTVQIRQAMDFWFPRSDADIEANSRKAGAFSLRNVKKVRFVTPNGKEIPGNTLPSKAIVTTLGKGAETRVILKWNNEIGETQTMQIKTIADLPPRSLLQYGIWDRVTYDD